MIPDIPNASELKPFPSKVAISFKGHSTQVRSISVSPCGKFLATGDQSGNVYVWDVLTSWLQWKYKFSTVDCV